MLGFALGMEMKILFAFAIPSEAEERIGQKDCNGQPAPCDGFRVGRERPNQFSAKSGHDLSSKSIQVKQF